MFHFERHISTLPLMALFLLLNAPMSRGNSGAILCYADEDKDGYGNPDREITLRGEDALAGCAAYVAPDAPGLSWVKNALDCDDDPSACGANCYPGAKEICDGYPNNCFFSQEEGIEDERLWRSCQDLEGSICYLGEYRCENGQLSCFQTGLDPSCSEEELADGCDYGEAPSIYYRDRDGDGFGDNDDVVVSCIRPQGYVRIGGDCDDNPEHCGDKCHPGAEEICDGFDNDCSRDTPDGSGDSQNSKPCAPLVDEPQCLNGAWLCADAHFVCTHVPGSTCESGECDGMGPPKSYFRDRDGDGFGDPNDSIVACEPPSGYVANSQDCDDDPAKCGANCHPGRTEICGDGYDNDCNGKIDDGTDCAPVYCYLDEDTLGEGDPGTRVLLPEGFASCAEYTDPRYPGASWVEEAWSCESFPERCREHCIQDESGECSIYPVLSGGTGCEGSKGLSWLMALAALLLFLNRQRRLLL